MTSVATRTPYQGVLGILQFNWPQYVGAAVVIALALVLLPLLHSFWRAALLLAVTATAFWAVSSVLVSHYIYDRFPLYDFTWIKQTLGKTPASWVNIHCGFDETSGLLRDTFPYAKGQVINIYDPSIMTESSIAKAQRDGQSDPSIAGSYSALGCTANHFESAFLIFAAHELRSYDQRVQLLAEVKRLLVPGGDLIVVEHSRDVWNFLAFGPGFLHFFSRKAWLSGISEAGLSLETSFKMTPFVTVYGVRKSA